MKTHLALAFGFVTSLYSASGVAAPPTKAECLEANSSAQDLRRAGKLRAAKQKLALCVAATCPGPVREDCAQRIDEIEKAMPTIIFEAKDGTGNDLTDVKVRVDGAPFAEELDGSALAVDPGPHVFEFQASSFPAIEKKLVLRETEKSRHERLLFGASERPHVETTQASGPSLVPAIIAFGVGGVGLIVGLIFTGALASSDCSIFNNSASICAGDPSIPNSPAQAQQSTNAALTAGLVTGFAIAGIGATVGTLLLLTSTGSAKSNASKRYWIRVGGVGLQGAFW